MKTIPNTDHANTGLGERLPRADETPAQPTLKPTGTQGVWDRGGKLETHIPTPAQQPWPWPQYAPVPAPIVAEDSGGEE